MNLSLDPNYLAAGQGVLAALALAISYRQLRVTLGSWKDLRRSMEAEGVTRAEIESVLRDLSAAEERGKGEMERVLAGSNGVAKAIHRLGRRQQRAVASALTQPSDTARRSYLLERARA